MPIDTPPTADQLKLRYPEFTHVDDERVNMFIEDANGHVDNTWLKRDQLKAVSALAAHLMALENEPSRSIASAATGGTVTGGAVGSTDEVKTFLKKRTVGDVSSEYEQVDGSSSNSSSSSATVSSKGDYDATPYGKVFYKLLKLNHRGVTLLGVV